MSDDTYFMTRALKLARQQYGRTGANPAVGCIILNSAGLVIAEAATGDGGRPHAEELALSCLSPEAAKGGTIYVTLEPCRERSSDTPSCSEHILAAGLKRAVIATKDPHPQGAGGLTRLEEGGVEVKLGLKQAEADALYADFFDSVT